MDKYFVVVENFEIRTRAIAEANGNLEHEQTVKRNHFRSGDLPRCF